MFFRAVCPLARCEEKFQLTRTAKGPNNKRAGPVAHLWSEAEEKEHKCPKPERAADSDLSAWIHLGVAAPVGRNRLALERSEQIQAQLSSVRARRGDTFALATSKLGAGSALAALAMVDVVSLPSAAQLRGSAGSVSQPTSCTDSSPPSSGQGHEVPPDAGGFARQIAGDRRAAEPSEL
ncbi:hypothetical protein V7S43_015410 [Phytophthora oleae]|uniref:Uncharacterized protein n=1 Tax=Phytophthora oleae TaxID=2107226 RepID=A0ABD3F176_9STRA